MRKKEIEAMLKEHDRILSDMKWERRPPIDCEHCGSSDLQIVSRERGAVNKVKCMDCGARAEREVYKDFGYTRSAYGSWKWYIACKKVKGEEECKLTTAT